METLNRHWTRAVASRDERGDVPGWVMITVMTAALVVVILGIARDEFSSMLESAFNQVRGESN